MATYDYKKLQGVANRLCNKFGRQKTITINRYATVTGLNPSGDDEPSRTPLLSGSFTGPVLPATPKNSNKKVDDLMLGEWRFVPIEALNAPFEPMATDEVIINGEAWEVDSLSPVDPDGLQILYKLVITKR